MSTPHIKRGIKRNSQAFNDIWYFLLSFLNRFVLVILNLVFLLEFYVLLLIDVMWGGLKGRKNYGVVFRNWSATKPLEELRRALFKEPRPWYLLFSIHEHRHYLSDHHGARLLSWSTTVLQLSNHSNPLRPSENAHFVSRQRNIYKYIQESVGLLLHSHAAGEQTFYAYMRLCAVGKDLTAAYRFYKYWDELGRPESRTLLCCAWLAIVAAQSPSALQAEEMILQVYQLYREYFIDELESRETSRIEPSNSFMTAFGRESNKILTAEEKKDRKYLLACFVVVGSQMQHSNDTKTFLDFIQKIPMSVEVAALYLNQQGWPSASPHQTFRELERGVVFPSPTVDYPRLSSSLLHPEFQQCLEAASFNQNTEKVVKLLRLFERRVKEEKEKCLSRRDSRKTMGEIWFQPYDASASEFRKKIVEIGGLSSELYHYLVVSLASTKPSAAIRTLERMKAANLRVLDITRAVMITKVEGSPDTQASLFDEQLAEIETREKLDRDHETNTSLEAFWKYDYPSFFHYQNALNREEFFFFLMPKLGPAKVQELLMSSESRGSLSDDLGILPNHLKTEKKNDLIVLDEDLRSATRRYMTSQFGEGTVEQLLNEVTRCMPKLDISVLGALPFFDSYALLPGENIATDVHQLRKKLSSFTCIYLMDASFIETSDSFRRVGLQRFSSEESSESSCSSLVLFPYVTLLQLASSIKAAAEIVSFDPALQGDLKSESFLATERLQSIYSMISSSQFTRSSGNDSLPYARILHFTESFLSHMISLKELQMFRLHPESSVNDQMLLLLALIRTVAPANARVVLCTDDFQLRDKVHDFAQPLYKFEKVPQLFAGKVEILATAPPKDAIDINNDVLVNDNPVLGFNVDQFTPVVFPVHSSVSTTTSERDNESSFQQAVSFERKQIEKKVDVPSPWLNLLNEESESLTAGDGVDFPLSVATNMDDSTENPKDDLPKLNEDLGENAQSDTLWDLYETFHDVAPLAENIVEAADVQSLFHEFSVMEPEEREALAQKSVSQSALTPHSGPQKGEKRRKLSILAKERLNHSGYSRRDRTRLARRISNQSGGRVPFNLRFKVVQADISNPRNRGLISLYQAGVLRKRQEYLRKRP